jgi:hypothetical protein
MGFIAALALLFTLPSAALATPQLQVFLDPANNDGTYYSEQSHRSMGNP